VVRDQVLDPSRQIVDEVVIGADHQVGRVVAERLQAVLVRVFVIVIVIRELTVVEAIGSN
jgi:hypothetical protein